MDVRVIRTALFALVGSPFFALWLVTDPGNDASQTQSEWTYVLWFSTALLALALAVPMFGRLVGGRWVAGLSLLAGAGVALCSLANVVEDGLQFGWALWGFIVGTAITYLGLFPLTVAVMLTSRGGRRLLALVPAATGAAITFWVVAGGVIMLAAWLGAATLAFALPTRIGAQTAAATP
ncbi:MAG: hypothetical protein ABI927_03340 [Gaiellaceae bacterium]